MRHPRNALLLVSRVTATPVGPRMFIVQVEYSSPEVRDAADPDQPPDPLSQPPDVQWGLVVETEPIDVAYDEDNELTIPVVNTAGAPLDPPIEREFRDRSLSYTLNQSAFDWQLADEYNDVVNADRFWDAEPGHVRCLGITASFVVEDGFRYWRNRYDFLFRKDGWLRRKLNVGTMELRNGELRQIRDAEGNPISEPVTLTVSGAAWDWREQIVPGGSGTVNGVQYETGRNTVWLKFKIYPTVPFAPLRIP
jgi:hypothetical protein